MVNITYDACEFCFVLFCNEHNLLTSSRTPANTIIYTDDSGTVFVYNPGDIAWTLASTALVWIMIPGLGYLYSGLLRRKNALSMIYLSMMCIRVVSFQAGRIPPFE
jgi:hypothetical protein